MSVTEIYVMLTTKYNFNPTYVLDEMEWFEVNAVLKYSYYSKQEEWEQTRLLAYLIAQTNSSKKFKPMDIIKFPWDNDGEMHETSISKEEIERLNNIANQMEKQINGKR